MRLVEGEGSVLDAEEKVSNGLMKCSRWFGNKKPVGVFVFGRVGTRLGLARTVEWMKFAW